MLKNEVLINMGAFFITCLIIGIIFIIAGVAYSFAPINRAGLILIGILFIIGSISIFRKIQKLNWG